ncbi:MAG: hypothetical protein Q7V21_06155 [Methylophaga sp.]|nr:hypothetical protein [Methylophaga sp.]
MIDITNNTTLFNSRLATSTINQYQAVTDTTSTTTPPSPTTTTVSNLALQLSEAANLAETRDASLSRNELAHKAKTLIDQIIGNSYDNNKLQHDKEVPDTDDPELLARAKQATNFVNGMGSNPFKGMSRDQLSLIAYDESGSFTVNERRAAWLESYDQEQVWRRKVVAQAMDEYNRTGKLTNFFTEVLNHYKELPAIEQAQYPEDYESQLQQWIDLDFNYITHQAEGKGSNPTSLIELLMAQGAYANKDAAKAEADNLEAM